MRPTPLHGLILDLALILAATALALGHVISGEAAFYFLTLYSGAKLGTAAMGGGGGPGASGGTSSAPPSASSLPSSSSSSSSTPGSLRLGDVSIVAAIGLSLLALFVPHYRGA